MSFSGRSALSVKDTSALLDAARSWIAENLPADVRDEHGRLFDRRMRFSFARLWIIWRDGKRDADAIADILNFAAFDRAVFKALASAPVGARFLMLGWVTLRRPPFGPWAMVEAWWRAKSFRWFGQPGVQVRVDAVNRLAASLRQASR